MIWCIKTYIIAYDTDYIMQYDTDYAVFKAKFKIVMCLSCLKATHNHGYDIPICFLFILISHKFCKKVFIM